MTSKQLSCYSRDCQDKETSLLRPWTAGSSQKAGDTSTLTKLYKHFCQVSMYEISKIQSTVIYLCMLYIYHTFLKKKKTAKAYIWSPFIKTSIFPRCKHIRPGKKKYTCTFSFSPRHHAIVQWHWEGSGHVTCNLSKLLLSALFWDIFFPLIAVWSLISALRHKQQWTFSLHAVSILIECTKEIF